MRAILDTNVFISGIFFAGPPYRILKAWRDGKIQLVISPEILEEYRRVSHDLSKQFPAINLAPILEMIAVKAEVFPNQSLPRHVCIDPDDDKFLAWPVTGKCKLIISGDKHLLSLAGYRGIKVIKPREFVQDYLSKPGKQPKQ